MRSTSALDLSVRTSISLLSATTQIEAFFHDLSAGERQWWCTLCRRHHGNFSFGAKSLDCNHPMAAIFYCLFLLRRAAVALSRIMNDKRPYFGTSTLFVSLCILCVSFTSHKFRTSAKRQQTSGAAWMLGWHSLIYKCYAVLIATFNFFQQGLSFVCKYAVGADWELIVGDDSVCIYCKFYLASVINSLFE